jgi:TolA-binding protein
MTNQRYRDSKDSVHAENLSALDRRGALESSEGRRLAMALAASPALRCSHQVGSDFDTQPTDVDGDAALLAFVARKARDRFETPSAPRQSPLARALPWLGAASLLLVGSAAAAVWWPYARVLVVAQPASLPSALETGATKQRGIAPARVQPSTAMNAERAAPPVHVPPRPHQQSTRVERDAKGGELETAAVPQNFAVAVPSATALPATAAALFGDANAARRRGDIDTARSLYARLRATYPTANETALSYVLTARVNLKSGSASTALLEFGQYLALAPAGPLAEEALQGRAAAYRQLNRPAEEAQTWRELLRRYPNSVYAGSANKRLDELR